MFLFKMIICYFKEMIANWFSIKKNYIYKETEILFGEIFGYDKKKPEIVIQREWCAEQCFMVDYKTN